MEYVHAIMTKISSGIQLLEFVLVNKDYILPVHLVRVVQIPYNTIVMSR